MKNTPTKTHDKVSENFSRPTLEDFTAIYSLYHESIFRYFSWRCRDPEISQDLTQETFLRFCVCLQRKEKILHTRGFLYRIAHNLIVDYVRKKKEKSLEQLIEAGMEPTMDPWQQTYNRLDLARPMNYMNMMSPPYRQVLHYRFVAGLAPAQIAMLVGETSNTVSVRISRGMKHLRFLLKEPPRLTRNILVKKPRFARNIAPEAT